VSGGPVGGGWADSGSLSAQAARSWRLSGAHATASPFGLTAVVLVVFGISSAHYESWYIPLACGGFGYRSYRAGFAARRRGALLAADR
jgi:5-hydroxyisourate hydrolase-like protein (transthyretin family)